MVYPTRFIKHPLEPTVADGYFPNRNVGTWTNQRFTIGTPQCRLINLKTYRWFMAQEDREIILPKQAFMDAIFTPEEQVNGANIHQVGRYIVNSVSYKPVFQMRRKGERGMCWRFHSPMDVALGTAYQIGVWLPDFLIRNVAEYNSPADFSETTLDEELEVIRSYSDDELHELFMLDDELSRGGA